MTAQKQRYNELLARFRKAEEYLDNPGIELSERERHIPLALEIIGNMNKLLKQIEKYTEHEVLHGFTLEVKQIDDTTSY